MFLCLSRCECHVLPPLLVPTSPCSTHRTTVAQRSCCGVVWFRTVPVYPSSSYACLTCPFVTHHRYFHSAVEERGLRKYKSRIAGACLLAGMASACSTPRHQEYLHYYKAKVFFLCSCLPRAR
ncbi:unnamed protein product, partial [Ectocarpus sp. 13 AM-2016]